jgi:hypothetical protein
MSKGHHNKCCFVSWSALHYLKTLKYDFLTLEKIKNEFTTIKNNDVIYMVNGFIKDNIDTFKLDRNYIFKVKLLIQKHL